MINRLLFPQISPLALGVFRFFFFLVTLFAIAIPSAWGPEYLDMAFLQKVSFFKFFHIPIVETGTFVLLKNIWLLALFFSAVGFLTFVASWSSFFLGLYLIGMKYNFGFDHEADAAIVLAMLAMALAPTGTAFSLDSWFRHKLNKKCEEPVLASYYYGWPLGFMKYLWVFLFFSSVLLKFRLTGTDWFQKNILHHVLTRTMADPIFPNSFEPQVSIVIRNWLIERPDFCRLLTWLTLLLEFAMPLALFSRRAAQILVSIGLIMLFAVWLTLRHFFFFGSLPLFLAWLPWAAIVVRANANQKKDSDYAKTFLT